MFERLIQRLKADVRYKERLIKEQIALLQKDPYGAMQGVDNLMAAISGGLLAAQILSALEDAQSKKQPLLPRLREVVTSLQDELVHSNQQVNRTSNASGDLYKRYRIAAVAEVIDAVALIDEKDVEPKIIPFPKPKLPKRKG